MTLKEKESGNRGKKIKVVLNNFMDNLKEYFK